jgi:hypothetical protein
VLAAVVVETTISLAAHLAVAVVVALASSSIRASRRLLVKSTADSPESRVEAVVRLALIAEQTVQPQRSPSPELALFIAWEEVAVAHTRVAKLVIRVAVAAAVVLSTVAQPRLGEQRIRVAARTEALATQVVQAAVAA